MSESDIVQDFLAESYENLDRLDRELVGLEKHPHDRDKLASVFRTIHTIKGTCGFLGFNKLEKVTHVGESLLARLRDGQLTLIPEHTTALLNMVDAVRQMLKEIQSTGQDGKAEYPELLETLTRQRPRQVSLRRQHRRREKRSLPQVRKTSLGLQFRYPLRHRSRPRERKRPKLPSSRRPKQASPNQRS